MILNDYQISFNAIADSDSSFTLSTITGNDYYTIMNITLSYSILKSSNVGEIILSYNLDYNSPQTAVSDEFKIQSGQPISISIVHSDNSVLPIFKGYIRSKRFRRNVNGSYLYLYVDNTLGQFIDQSANNDWNSATKQYNTILTNLQGAFVNFDTLLTQIGIGSLVSNIPIGTSQGNYNSVNWWNIINGQAPSIPTKLWAVLQTNKTRDEIIRELLFPYQRLIFQLPNGNINIQPLFYDDYASIEWNIDITDNNSNIGKWLDIDIIDSSADIVNRIDCQFGVLLPVDQYGGDANLLDNNVYISSFANPTYYPRINELYNTGLYTTAKLMQQSLDTSIITNSALTNTFIQSLGYKTLQSVNDKNKIYKYPPAISNVTVPQIYASNQMASNLINAYSCNFTYDYNSMVDTKGNSLEFPLGKIINVTGYGEIQSGSMICAECVFTVNASTGSNIKTTLFPIESITGAWFNLKATS